MKALACEIHWNKGWANEPKAYILVDEIPKDLVYDVHIEERGALFLGEKDGYVSYFSHSADLEKNDGGFYGDCFTIKLRNGEEVTLKGPWSSRSGVMNKFFQTKCIEVGITDEPSVMDRGYTYMSGNVTVDFLQEAIKLCEEEVELIPYDSHGEIYMVPRLKNNPCTHEGRNANCRCPICGHKVYEYDDETGTYREA